MPESVLAVVGPTATGKTDLSLEVAGSLDAEIVSIDSTLIYRGMDIGTDKPTPEQQACVPHHLVDVVDPNETVTVAQFQRWARVAIDGILSRGKTPLLAGGSGLYFRAVVDPLEFPRTDPDVRARLSETDQSAESLHKQLAAMDPEAAASIEPANVRRTIRALEVITITGRKFSSYRTSWDRYESIYDLEVVGLDLPRDELDARIEQRVDRHLAEGLLDEVESLVRRGVKSSATSVQALGYAQLIAYLDGQISMEDARRLIINRTRRFARRQWSWFRADPRVRWFLSDQSGAASHLMGDRVGL